MSLVKWMLINLVLLIVTMTPVWGLSGARLLGHSPSGQTALFNLGSHDGVKEGDYAVIVKEIRSLESRNLRIIPVAKARNVKMNTGNSIWILYKMYDSKLLVKGQSYLILAESTMLSGRRDPRFGRISVITEKDKTAFQTQSVLSDDKDRISKLKHQYPEIEPLHKKESRIDHDGDLVDVERWNKIKRSKYRTALYKSPSEEEFRKEVRLNTFEELVTAYLLRVNNPNFNYDSFYDEQMKSEFSNEFRKRSSFSTEYENFLSLKGQKAISDAKIYRSILEKGESWSEDFSDEELGAVLNEVSILQEKDRRTYIVANPNRYFASLGYGLSITDVQTESDPRYRREGSYSIDLNFEVIPVLKHETLERFTIDASFRANKSAFETQNLNASLDEYSVSGGVNWYPVYAPYVIEAPNIFLGTYIRSGFAAVKSPTANQKSNYTLLSLPGVRLGMLYNFNSKLGLRIAASMETLNLDRYEQSDFNSVLPDQVKLVEGKMNFALSYSF